MPRSAPYVTYSIIGVTAFVYVLQLASQALVQTDIPVALFAKANDLIRAGQLWRFLTPALVHGSLAHIGFNMYALFSFGTGLERHFGRKRFLLLYVLGAFTGNVMSFLFSPGYSVGASTAIFGLPGIDNWGHIGGLLGGLIFTSFAGPLWEIEGISPAYHLVDKRPLREVIIGAATVVLIFGGLAMWGMVR